MTFTNLRTSWQKATVALITPVAQTELTRTMKLEIELPDKYAQKLRAVEEVEPSVQDQIEIEVLPQVLRLINDAHRQLEQQANGRPGSSVSDQVGSSESSSTS